MDASPRNGQVRGFVYIVGAGPGAADLITLRGLRCLQEADVILYDRMVSPELLAMARPDAERIYVGKQRGHMHGKQREINELMVRYAREGRVVCRLKGGDPFVFGRGGEEAAVLAAAGIPYAVVPGVTAAVAAPGLAGIPVTHRACTHGFAVITAHDPPDRLQVDWEAMARVGTLVILMGTEHLAATCARLIQAGLSPDTPAAAVQWASWPQQRSVVTTLGRLPQVVEAAEMGPPTTVVVGQVVAHRVDPAAALAAPGGPVPPGEEG